MHHHLRDTCTVLSSPFLFLNEKSRTDTEESENRKRIWRIMTYRIYWIYRVVSLFFEKGSRKETLQSSSIACKVEGCNEQFQY